MALPKWITPAGQLGIVPELDYYEFPLDAYDASGGTLVYRLISGRLPLGLQIIPTGKIQGIPVSELGGDANVEYRFTIRVQNSITGGLTDRTFNITVTNVAPPVITPKNEYLGLYLDGTVVNLQLTAVEFTPGAELIWSLTQGELPEGLSLSASGLISGYIHPIPEPGPGSNPGWDLTPWSLLSWEFTRRAVSKTFDFTIEVFDGVNYDQSTYSLKVFPRSSLTADNDTLTVDTTTVESTLNLSIDSGEKHDPIIVTTQAELTPVRQGSFFSFDFNAIDLDGDDLTYSLPILASGAFDEQDFSTIASVPYVAAQPISGKLYEGVFPLAVVTNTAATMKLFSGNVITANAGSYITQAITGANSVVTENVVNSNNIGLSIIGSGFAEGKGNIAVNGVELVVATFNSATSTWSNVGVVPETVTTGEPVITIDRTSPALFNGDSIKVLGTNDLWYNATVNNSTTVRLTGNSKVTGNVGDTITQAISSTTATISNVGATVGTFTIAGASIIGSIQITGNLITANVGDFITQGSANATVTSNVTSAINIPVRYTAGAFTTTGGNIQINGSNIASYPTLVVGYASPLAITANVGDYITQPSTGANATVTANVLSATYAYVLYNSGTFATGFGSGNIQINGANVNVYPNSVVCETDVTATYSTSDVFYLNSTDPTAIAYINSVSTNSYPTSIVSVGVSVGSLAVEGTQGFDEGKFDQGVLALPPGLSIDPGTGWMTGQLPAQTINETTYDFELVVRKEDDFSYQASQLYTLTILGDLNNRINWITPSDIGSIQNGKVSDLFISAVSTKGKTLFYQLTGSHRLPQGLLLTSSGLISGRVSFEMFSLDHSATTIDGGGTTFDETYTFTVTASDIDRTVSADRTFTIRVINKNITPYENLYLRAMPAVEERDYFTSIIQNRTVFPQELIYRSEDPFFGLAKDIKTLFMPGLAPSTLAEYAQAAETNHFTKRFLFGEVKTAQVLDNNFNVKYEVVYLQLDSENDIESATFANVDELGPPDQIDLTGVIANPYYDADGNPFTIAYPNSTQNMESRMETLIGFANKGALPDWMTSTQADGRQIGFVHAVVLAYTVPNASKLIAYRFNQQNYNLNSIDFTVDRYDLDNNYTENFDIALGEFITSSETTFDRYPRLASVFSDTGTVDYASTIAFEEINNRSLTAIRSLGGIDGVKNIKTGDRLVFATQEFRRDQNDIGEYNQGWSDVATIWDGDLWDYDSNTATTSDDLGWDSASYVPGYNEHNLDANVANQRIGIWEVTVSSENIVELAFVQSVEFYDKIYVRNGFTYGRTNIYYDPVIKTGNLYANYSIIPQQINTQYTSFDGNGTRFFDYRDEYSEPGTGDKYIKFAKLGVFN